jgi:DNA-binding transcriptional MerR regulator
LGYIKQNSLFCNGLVLDIKQNILKFVNLNLNAPIKNTMKELNLPEKLYYSIGEVAAAFDVNISLIRHWEKEFPMINPKKNKKGNRFFRPDDVAILRLIYKLVKEKGYTLEGARIALSNNKSLKGNMEILDRLAFVRAELIKLKAEFNNL